MAGLVRTPTVRRDVKSIARHIAQESGSREIAKRFVEKINQKCRLYAQNPEMGESRPDLGTGVRCFSVGQYVVFYRCLGKIVQLLRVFHGNRDIPQIWERE